MKYEMLYAEMDKLDMDITTEISHLEDRLELSRKTLVLMEQELAELILKRAELRQFLKESGVIDSETSDWE